MVQPVDLWVRELNREGHPVTSRPATDAEVIARLRQVEGVEERWWCAAGGFRFDRCDLRHGWQQEDNPKCGPILVVPVPDSRKEE